MTYRSFTDADTHFEIIRSDSPVTVDGFALNEPTGEVKCDECRSVAMCVDKIGHDEDCPQRDVKSRNWEQFHD
ncbi:hypothetical protein [Halostella pelagica]|uniref:hypothetical protein n=1 Tax=Halostella pelagica TaxID=2583824 RepID=UPI0010813745|nr:hypothetical protein [Halostella pelagica]